MPGGFLHPGGFSIQGGSAPGGGLSMPEGGVWQGEPPPVNRMTDRCKNITLAKTSFRPVKIVVKIFTSFLQKK